jgi:hypothetical protein
MNRGKRTGVCGPEPEVALTRSISYHSIRQSISAPFGTVILLCEASLRASQNAKENQT